jgi:putative oxidoreductase
MKYVLFLARLFIGAIFIYASIYKVLDPATFAVAVRNYMIVPPEWTNLVALTLPWIELAAGVFLILGILIRPSAFLTTGMLAVFFGAVLYAYSIGLDIDCGCFGSAVESKGRIGLYHITRDSILLLISFLIVAFDKGDFSIASENFLNGKLRMLNS